MVNCKHQMQSLFAFKFCLENPVSLVLEVARGNERVFKISKVFHAIYKAFSQLKRFKNTYYLH